MDLSNRTILITGATDGIGKVLAIEVFKIGVQYYSFRQGLFKARQSL